ncbi:MAG TPA: hypothetical protein PKC72_16955 [Chitinophagaceae bacterium]|nr:hypothetical protein [Chitinophagaceae bacterium]
MHRRITLVFTLSLSLIFTSVFSQAKEKKVLIRILQDDALMLNEFQSQLTLKKKTFKFQVLLQNIEGVYVFASIRDSVYRFTEQGPIRDFIYLPLLELREDKFNTYKELNISETGWSYWFYNPKADWFPFQRDVVPIDSSTVICSKVIKQLYDVADEKAIKLKELKSPLYLFFIAVSEYDDKGKPIKELMRRKIKIDWEDDD